MWSRAILWSKAQWPFSGTDIITMDFRTVLLTEPNGQLERAVRISLLAEREKMKKRNKQTQTLKDNLLCVIISIP